MTQLKWFEFNQNNSGGSFDKEMGYTLWVQAHSPSEADAIAESNGVYFNGCAIGRDCDCCGDRWSSLWSDDKGEDFPVDNKYAKNWGLTVKVIPYNKTIRDITEEDQKP